MGKSREVICTIEKSDTGYAIYSDEIPGVFVDQSNRKNAIDEFKNLVAEYLVEYNLKHDMEDVYWYNNGRYKLTFING